MLTGVCVCWCGRWQVFAVDIHPAARLGNGILLDHGTGVVIGETAVVGDQARPWAAAARPSHRTIAPRRRDVEVIAAGFVVQLMDAVVATVAPDHRDVRVDVARAVAAWRHFPHADVREAAPLAMHRLVERAPFAFDMRPVRVEVPGVPCGQGEQANMRAGAACARVGPAVDLIA